MYRSLIVFLCFVMFLFVSVSCQDEGLERIEAISSMTQFNTGVAPTFSISTTRSDGNILRAGALRGLSSSNPLALREVECGEFVILTKDLQYIWPGSILYKSSLSTAEYKPIICRRNPLTVSFTLRGSSSREIEQPSNSAYYACLQENLKTSIVPQSSFFQLSIDQFSSYEELKLAYGYNVQTSFIIGKHRKTTTKEEHRIKKATGLYVRFLQTSFKAMLDYPEDGIGYIPEAILDSAVYVNSVTYGRLGILTVETDVDVETAHNRLEKAFSVLFVNGKKQLEQSEKEFLDGCEFKLFTAGGNAEREVASFRGYDEFMEHIVNNTFSKSSHGVPILYTLNNARDDASYRCRFKVQTFRDPVYVQLVSKADPNNRDKLDYSLKFYRTKSRIPTIPPDDIEFVVEKWRDSYQGNSLVSRLSLFNKYLRPSIDIERGVYIPRESYENCGDGTVLCLFPVRDGYYYKLLPSKDGSYEIID